MIVISDLYKTYAGETENVAALKNINLQINSGAFFTLLGPSGCGKSTLLRCIAGLETPDRGEIVVNGEVMFSSTKGINVAPNARRIGMVFQSYAIWPHMTVRQNVAFPLKVQRKPDDGRIDKALSAVGLAALGDRYASRLSGGQQQRVALARAIVGQPSVLLLDEPLSNLDAALRHQMRSELRRLQESLKLTSIYVTHDQIEALSLSDEIALILAGEINELATPRMIYGSPKSSFAAQFVGAANIIKGELRSDHRSPNGECTVATSFGDILISSTDPGNNRGRSGSVHVCVRPEKIRVLAEAPCAKQTNTFSATVKARSFMGHSTELTLELGTGLELRCICPDDDITRAQKSVFIHMAPSDVHLLPET
jgi:iron(III) transport system ATP-binding protein